MAGADSVVIATHHSSYDWAWLQAQARLIVDTRHVLPQARVAVRTPARARIRAPSTPRSSPGSSPPCGKASRPPFTATATRAGTSPSSTTSSRPTCGPAPRPAGGVFNIACGERYSLLGLVARLAELTGRPAEVRHADPRPGDVPHSQADISLARTTLGYEPAVGFSTGLAKTVAWLRR